MKNKMLLVPALSLLTAGASGQTDKPNVLFILTDDLQAGAIGSLYDGQSISPNIDGIIASGVSFTNAYVNGGITGAISMPSRAMLMTGRTLFEIEGDGMTIPKAHTTMPEHFRANGYTTFGTGKWHSDTESFNRSFSTAENIFFGGMHRYELNGHRSPRLNHYDPTGRYGAETKFIGDKFSSEMYADAAMDFLSGYDGREPFFAYVAFTSPHDPRNNMPEYGRHYDYRKINLPANYRPAPGFDNGELTVRDELAIPAPRTEEEVKRELAFYYGMINEVDQQIGRLIGWLKESGRWENTILVFAADNGLAMGQHGLMGKQNLYQHSSRVPLVLAGGPVGRTGQSDAYCYLADIYPTLCRLTGTEAPASVTGKSLGAALDGDKGKRESLLLAYSSVQRAIIKDGWKLIYYNVNGARVQLFDLNNDPAEMNDLSDDPSYHGKIKEYMKLLAAEMKASGDFCDMSKKDFGWPDKITFNQAIKLFRYE